MTVDKSGLVLVERLFAAGPSLRGIGKTMNFAGHSAELGHVVMHGNPTEDHYNPLGTVHGGYAATLLDGALALAVQTTLDANSGYATLDLKVTYLRALTKDSGPVLVDAKVIHRGTRVVASEASLFDCKNKLCAHATATFMILPPNEKRN